MHRFRRALRYHLYYPIRQWAGSEEAWESVRISAIATATGSSAFVLAWALAGPPSPVLIIVAALAAAVLVVMFMWMVLDWQGYGLSDLWSRLRPAPIYPAKQPAPAELIVSAEDLNRSDRWRSGPYDWNYPPEYGDD